MFNTHLLIFQTSQQNLGRFLSPYPIGGSQPSNSGEGGPGDGSTSVASSSSSRPTNNSGSTSVISGTIIVTSNPGKEIVPDAYGTDSKGDLNVERGNVLVKKGVIRNESSKPIRVKPENGKWVSLDPGEEYDKKYDGVKAHGKIIKVSGASRIGITVVDKLHEYDSGFRYYVKDMSRNIRWNMRIGRIKNRSQNTFFDETDPPIGWEE
jgi:hypothetical protein